MGMAHMGECWAVALPVLLVCLGLAARMAAGGAGVLPADRLVEWRPGVEDGVPDVPVVSNLADYGPAADGKTDDAPVFQRALADVASPGALYVPPGTYMLRSVLRLRSGVVLRGAGAEVTHMVFDAPDYRNRGAVEMFGSTAPESEARGVMAGAEAGSRELELDSVDGIEPGRTVWVFQENDAELLYTRPEWDTTWARNSVGQLVRVEEVDGRRVRIDVPLRLTYKQELRPRLLALRPVTGAGLEGVHIKRLDQEEGHLVSLREAVNCWVKDCELDYCCRAHVSGSRSRFVTVSGCYIHHAWNYGGGGHGYGVSLSHSASDWLVTDNIFRHLRHSMIVQCGANGHVFSYNYSFEHQMCDISVHGHYAYMNLFEGNVLQNAVVGDYWGPAGPLNTLYRNRVVARPHGRTGAVRVQDHSHRTTVLANTIPLGPIQIKPDTEDCFVGANLVQGRADWGAVPVGTPLPPSLYLSRPPEFWGSKPWPAIGADVDFAAGALPVNIPAQDRAVRLLAGE